MRDGDAMVSVKLHVLLRCLDCMGCDQTVIEHPVRSQPTGCRGGVKRLDRLPFHPALRHVQPHRQAPFGRGGHRPAQKGKGAGLDPVGGEHRLDQALMAARDVICERKGIVQALHPTRLVELRLYHPGRRADHPTGAVGRPQPDAQAHLACRFGGRLEFGDGLAPGPVKQGGNGQRRGDAVAQKLREGEALLEGQFFGCIHLIGAAIDVGLRPGPALGPAGAVVDRKKRGVEVGQGVEVDKAGRDQRFAKIDPARDLAREGRADVKHPLAFDHHFGMLQQAMAGPSMPDDPPRPKCGPASGTPT